MSFRRPPGRRGAGRAREALSLVVGYAFDDLRAHKVTANAYEDSHYYGLLETEWRERANDAGTG